MSDYKPKVGERARLVSSPDTDDHVLCGETMTIEHVDKYRRSYYWRVRACGGPERYVHRDAVWEPVAAQPEPAAVTPAWALPRDPNRQRHDVAWSQPPPLYPPTLADDPLPVVPKPTAAEALRDVRQAIADVVAGKSNITPSHLHREGPRSYSCNGGEHCPDRRQAQPEPPASEPSDDELFKIGVQARFSSDAADSTESAGNRAERRALFDAGLKRGREESNAALASLAVAHAAEVERLRGELADVRHVRDGSLRREGELLGAIERCFGWANQHEAEAADGVSVIERAGKELAEARARPADVARLAKSAPLGVGQDESVSRYLRRWQDWAAALLRERGLQLDDGEHGDEPARRILGELLGVRREGPVPTSDAVYTAIRDASRWRGSGYMRPARIAKMARAVLALFSPEPRGIPETFGHTDKTPDGQKAETDVTVCDSEILRVGAPAAEVAADFETVRRASPATSERPAAERGDGAGVAQAPGGEGLRGPGVTVGAEPKGQPEPARGVRCRWEAHMGHSSVRCDQMTDHPDGMCDPHRKLANPFNTFGWLGTVQPDDAEARASVALDKGDTQTRVCEPDGLDGMPTKWRERIERLETQAADNAVAFYDRLSALERAVERLGGK